MSPIEMPAFRLTSDCIWNSFRSSNKSHLILTGSRKSGKSTLLSELLSTLLPRLTPCPLPDITTWAEPGKAVYLRDNATGKTVQVGMYNDSLPGAENQMRLLPEGFRTLGNQMQLLPESLCTPGNQMQLLPEGFRTLGRATLQRCMESESEWVSMDEIGYLETGCPEYCNEIRKLMDRKRLIAVVRKQSLPFLEELCRRSDIFLVDLDAPFGHLGCVIMASGLGRRFGGNKLMADFKGKPLIHWALHATERIFERRVVVTRHKEVEELCRKQEIEVIFHDLPYRSDTVRLGLQALAQDVDGCMFCPGDQPLLKWDTVASLALNVANDNATSEKAGIWRPAHEDTVGSPVLFPKWTFPELLTLPEGKGGSFVLKKYPEQVRMVPVRDKYELMDIDSPEDLDFLSKHDNSDRPVC